MLNIKTSRKEIIVLTAILLAIIGIIFLMPESTMAAPASLTELETAKQNLVATARTAAIIIAVIVAIGVGIGFLVSGDQGREKIKAKLPWIGIGLFVVLFSPTVIGWLKAIVGTSSAL
ncbi:MAG: TrbC/VirB2 family protein [Anaerovoracaceae bacterium]